MLFKLLFYNHDTKSVLWLQEITQTLKSTIALWCSKLSAYLSIRWFGKSKLPWGLNLWTPVKVIHVLKCTIAFCWQKLLRESCRLCLQMCYCKMPLWCLQVYIFRQLLFCSSCSGIRIRRRDWMKTEYCLERGGKLIKKIILWHRGAFGSLCYEIYNVLHEQ